MVIETISGPIAPVRWGQDHFSLLGYLAACFDGVIDRRRVRCNENRHPLLMSDAYGRTTAWKNEWSTRLKDVTIFGHDDWDCLEDLEVAGFVDVISMVNGLFRMTAKGNDVAFKLREHKRLGGTFATFETT